MTQRPPPSGEWYRPADKQRKPLPPAFSARWVGEVAAFVPDAVTMLTAVLRDPRVPRTAKMQAGGLALLGLGPWDVIPLVGQLDAILFVGFAARRLADAAGTDILREHWKGSDEGFQVMLSLIDARLRPRRAAFSLLRSFVKR